MRNKPFTFDEIFAQNEKRIHYHIHKLHIRDPHAVFYQEGLCALWHAYETYQPNKGPMSTYFNFVIKNRLIDLIRKESRDLEKKELLKEIAVCEYTSGNHRKNGDTATQLVEKQQTHVLEDSPLWSTLQRHLTRKQWLWIDHYIIKNRSIKDIAKLERTTVEAVKSWGKQVRRKLRDPIFQNQIGW